MRTGVEKALFGVGVILLLVGWLAVPDNGALVGREIITTGQFACDGAEHTAVWINDTDQVLRVRQAEVWLGMFRGSRADMWVWLAVDDGNVLGHTNWDHYTDPDAPHNLHYTYAPDYIEVGAEQAVVLRYGCQNIGKRTAVGDTAVTLWWLE